MPCSRNLFIHPICNKIQVPWTLLVYGLQPEYHYDFCWASHVVPVIKNTPANAGDARDLDLIPGLGRFPGVGNCNPLQYSCLGNAMVLKVVMSIKSSEVLAKRVDFRVHVFIIWWGMSGPGQPFLKKIYKPRVIFTEVVFLSAQEVLFWKIQELSFLRIKMMAHFGFCNLACCGPSL